MTHEYENTSDINAIGTLDHSRQRQANEEQAAHLLLADASDGPRILPSQQEQPAEDRQKKESPLEKADRFVQRGDFKAAIPLYQSALATERDQLRIAALRDKLGNAFEQSGDSGQAVGQYLQVLDIRRSHGCDPSLSVGAHRAVARWAIQRNEPDAYGIRTATEYMTKVIASEIKAKGPQAPGLVGDYALLGDAYSQAATFRRNGNLEKAVDAYREAFRIQRGHNGDKYSETDAYLMQRLAFLASQDPGFPREQLLKVHGRALQIQEAVYGASSMNLIPTLETMAKLAHPKQATELLQRVVNIQNDNKISDPLILARSHTSLSAAFKVAGDNSQAARHLNQALNNWQAHADSTVGKEADSLLQQGKAEAASRIYAGMLSDVESKIGSNNPAAARLESKLGDCSLARNDWTRASLHFENSINCQSNYFAQSRSSAVPDVAQIRAHIGLANSWEEKNPQQAEEQTDFKSDAVRQQLLTALGQSIELQRIGRPVERVAAGQEITRAFDSLTRCYEGTKLSTGDARIAAFTDWMQTLSEHKQKMGPSEVKMLSELTKDSSDFVGAEPISQQSITRSAEIYVKTLAIVDKHLGAGHPAARTLAERLLSVSEQMGVSSHSIAGEALVKCSCAARLELDEIAKKEKGADESRLPNLQRLANSFSSIRSYPEELNARREILSIEEKVYGADDKRTLETVHSLASLESTFGNAKAAVALRLRELKVIEQNQPHDDRAMITLFQDISSDQGKSGDHQGAARSIEKALAAEEKATGKKSDLYQKLEQKLVMENIQSGNIDELRKSLSHWLQLTEFAVPSEKLRSSRLALVMNTTNSELDGISDGLKNLYLRGLVLSYLYEKPVTQQGNTDDAEAINAAAAAEQKRASMSFDEKVADAFVTAAHRAESDGRFTDAESHYLSAYDSRLADSLHANANTQLRELIEFYKRRGNLEKVRNFESQLAR